MRILIFIGRLGTGGAERQVVYLANGIAEIGHEVMVFTIFPGGQNSKSIPSNKNSRLVSLWPWKGSNALVRSFQIGATPLLLRRSVRRYDPDYVYSMLYLSNLIAWLALRGKYAHRLIWGLRASKMKLNLKRAIPERFCAFFSRTVRLAIANSHSGMIYHQKRGYKPQIWKVVPNGIDVEKFQIDNQARNEVRKKLGVSNKTRLVGIVARLDPIKGHTVFLEAAASVIKRNDNFKFLIVGEGHVQYVQKLRVLANRLGLNDHVIWLGGCNEVVPIYSAIDLLASASLGEGFSNVIGEAMSCGIPCVVTNVGDSARIVQNTGLVVKPGDADELANAMLHSFDKENRAELKPVLRTCIKEKFSISAMTAATIDALHTLCKEGLWTS